MNTLDVTSTYRRDNTMEENIVSLKVHLYVMKILVYHLEDPT